MSRRCWYLVSSIFSAKLPISFRLIRTNKFLIRANFFLSIQGTVITSIIGTDFWTIFGTVLYGTVFLDLDIFLRAIWYRTVFIGLFLTDFKLTG